MMKLCNLYKIHRYNFPAKKIFNYQIFEESSSLIMLLCKFSQFLILLILQHIDFRVMIIIQVSELWCKVLLLVQGVLYWKDKIKFLKTLNKIFIAVQSCHHQSTFQILISIIKSISLQSALVFSNLIHHLK